MTDTTLYLLRHGESLANVDRIFASRGVNPPLSDAGIQQAEMQARSLKSVEFSSMYASPLVRARQTAEIVAQQCKLEPILSAALYEVDVGILEGRSQNDSQNIESYEGVVKNWEQGLADTGFQGGETLDDIEARFREFLVGLDSRAQGPVLVVGHCLLFMAAIWLFCGNHGPRFEDGHMGRAHLSVISGNGDSFRVLKFDVPPDEESGAQGTDEAPKSPGIAAGK